MSKTQKIIIKFNFFFALLSLVLYAALRFYNLFLRNRPKGDEGGYLKVFKLFLNEGYYDANVYGNSIVFNNFSSLFFKMGMNELMSLKTTSLFFGVLSIVFAWYFQKKYFSHLSKLYRSIALITVVNIIVVSSIFFTGINDMILSTLTILSFFIFYEMRKKKKYLDSFFILLGVLFSLMVLTRMMSLLIIISLFFILIVLLYNTNMKIKVLLKKILILLSTFSFMVLLFNFPSLKEKGKFSFHEKKINYKEISWSQLQYLSEIGYEKGDLKYRTHYSPKQVHEYLVSNGINSLPNSFFESITFDVTRTARVFFREFIFLVKPFTRLTGILFMISSIIFMHSLIKRKITFKKIFKEDILLFSFVYISALCLVITSYMEPRWIINVLLLFPIILLDKIHKFQLRYVKFNKFRFLFFNMQLLAIILMNVPYIYTSLIGILS